MASYAAKFECAICQGTLPDASFCTLNCGHCFHTVCAYTWLERSPTCPSCRASARKRHVRALNGVDAVQDAGDGSPQQHPPATDQQQVIFELQQQLAGAQQHGQELAATIEQLEDVLAPMKEKLKGYKHRCSELEGKRLQDAEHLMAANTELSKVKELYWSKKGEAERLRQELQLEQSRRAEADLRRKRAEASGLQLQLQNPSLSLKAMQQLIDAQDQDLQGLDQGQLLVMLARRNEQLRKAEASVAQLQAELHQQQSRADALQQAALSRQAAVEARAAKQQDECMKQVIQLEYRCDKLEHDNTFLQQQLQELQGVLLVLEGSTGPAQRGHTHQQRRAPAQRPPTSSLQHHQQQELGSFSQGSSEKENWPAAPTQQQDTQCADDWHTDVAAAVGHGSVMHRPAHMKQVPSFVKAAVAMGGSGLSVEGHLLRQGPDGKGSTTRHATSTGKRVTGETLKATHKKARAAPSSSNIMSFFGRKAS